MTPEVKDRIIKERILDVLESIIARQTITERLIVGQRGYSHDSRVITGLAESTSEALSRLRLALDSASDPPVRAQPRKRDIPIYRGREPHELPSLLPEHEPEPEPRFEQQTPATRPSLRVRVNNGGWVGKAGAILAALAGMLALLKTLLDSFH